MVYDIITQEDGRLCIIERELSGITGRLVEGDLDVTEAHYLKKCLDENAICCEDCGEAKTYDDIFTHFGKCRKCFDDMDDNDQNRFAQERILSCWTYY